MKKNEYFYLTYDFWRETEELYNIEEIEIKALINISWKALNENYFYISVFDIFTMITTKIVRWVFLFVSVESN